MNKYNGKYWERPKRGGRNKKRKSKKKSNRNKRNKCYNPDSSDLRIDKGSILPSSELDLITYKASSTYGDKYSADKPATEDGYWCSERNPESPQYWWISFEKVGMGAEIAKITFEETYPGAQYEFFASDTNECTKTGRTLISGTQEQISRQIFENGKLHHCYGLKITNVPNTHWGHLATLKGFRFFVCPRDIKVLEPPKRQ